MSDTPEAPVPVAEAPVSAPVAEVAPTESPAVSSSEAAASSSEAPVAAEVSASSSEPELTHESFEWDSWEGGVDTFPESVRPWAQSVSDYYSTRYGKLENQHKNLQALYDSVLVGGEDPRIKQYETDRTSWQTEREQYEAKQQELQASWDNDKSQFDAYEKAVYQYHVDQAGKQLEEFVNARPEILNDEVKYELFSSLLDEKWDLSSAGKLLDMPEAAVEIARKARAEGVPPAYALRFAEKQAPPQVQKPQPRPAATITSGAVSRTTPHVSTRGMGDAKSLEESRAMASARALKIHK